MRHCCIRDEAESSAANLFRRGKKKRKKKESNVRLKFNLYLLLLNCDTVLLPQKNTVYLKKEEYF